MYPKDPGFHIIHIYIYTLEVQRLFFEWFFRKDYFSGQIITTSAEVTLNGGLIRELPQNPLNSGLGIILICPDCFTRDIQSTIQGDYSVYGL